MYIKNLHIEKGIDGPGGSWIDFKTIETKEKGLAQIFTKEHIPFIEKYLNVEKEEV